MKLKSIFAAVRFVLILMLLSACNMPQSSKPAPTQTPEASPATGIQYHFVTNRLLIPATQEQAQAFGVNVDGDSQQQPDNLVGKLLTLLTATVPSLEIQSTIDQAMNSGQLISLHVVTADNLMNDSNVSWLIMQGQNSESAPAFDGSDRFVPDASVPVNLPIIGTLTNGHFSGGPGMAHIRVFLMNQLVEFDLIGVHIEADLSAMGCANGKVGGGVTVDEFRGKLLPAIANGLNQIIKMDQTMANTILPVFDADQDGIITAKELENNALLMLAASPDLDLLDASGKFNPGQDGVKDSYSIGLGFTCVPASFPAP